MAESKIIDIMKEWMEDIKEIKQNKEKYQKVLKEKEESRKLYSKNRNNSGIRS